MRAILFIPILYLVRQRPYQDRAFWGIGFPPVVPSTDQSTVYIVEEHLESRWLAVLGAGLQRLYLTTVLFSVEAEVDRESIEHNRVLHKLSNFHARVTGPAASWGNQDYDHLIIAGGAKLRSQLMQVLEQASMIIDPVMRKALLTSSW